MAAKNNDLAAMRGGARKGSGRKPGSTKITMTFKLEGAILELLRERVPRGKMTEFVESALLDALDQLPTAGSRVSGIAPESLQITLESP